MKSFTSFLSAFILAVCLSRLVTDGDAQSLPADLARVDSRDTKAVNALWGENPLAVQLRTTTNVVVADLQGPVEITMIHFAYPNRHASNTLSRATYSFWPRKPLLWAAKKSGPSAISNQVAGLTCRSVRIKRRMAK